MSRGLNKALVRSGERFSGYNRPKRTPGHPTKSHAVLARSGGQTRLIRFGQQGVRAREALQRPQDKGLDAGVSRLVTQKTLREGHLVPHIGQTGPSGEEIRWLNQEVGVRE